MRQIIPIMNGRLLGITAKSFNRPSFCSEQWKSLPIPIVKSGQNNSYQLSITRQWGWGNIFNPFHGQVASTVSKLKVLCMIDISIYINIYHVLTRANEVSLLNLKHFDMDGKITSLNSNEICLKVGNFAPNQCGGKSLHAQWLIESRNLK